MKPTGRLFEPHPLDRQCVDHVGPAIAAAQEFGGDVIIQSVRPSRFLPLIVLGPLIAACGSGVGARFEAGGLTKEPCPNGVSSELRCYVVTAKNVGGESGRVTGWVSMYKKAGGAALIESDKTQSEEASPGDTVELHLTAPPKPRGYVVTYGYAPSQSS